MAGCQIGVLVFPTHSAWNHPLTYAESMRIILLISLPETTSPRRRNSNADNGLRRWVETGEMVKKPKGRKTIKRELLLFGGTDGGT